MRTIDNALRIVFTYRKFGLTVDIPENDEAKGKLRFLGMTSWLYRQIESPTFVMLDGIDKELQDEINGIISNENIRVLVERPLIMTIGSFSILRIVNVTNGFNDITLPTGECLSIGFDWGGDMAIISPAPSLK